MGREEIERRGIVSTNRGAPVWRPKWVAIIFALLTCAAFVTVIVLALRIARG